MTSVTSRHGADGRKGIGPKLGRRPSVLRKHPRGQQRPPFAGSGGPTARVRPRGPPVEIHADPTATEGHALHRQAQTLLPTVRTGEGNPPPGRHDTMPGQTFPALQRPNGQPRRTRKPGRCGYLAVGDHVPARDPRDHVAQPREGRQGPRPRPGKRPQNPGCGPACRSVAKSRVPGGTAWSDGTRTGPARPVAPARPHFTSERWNAGRPYASPRDGGRRGDGSTPGDGR